MKLTKSKLIKSLTKELLVLNYKNVLDTFTGAQGLFVKRLDRDMILSLGLTISRFHNTKFTGAFYLSKSCRWSSVWGDIPSKSYERISFFLTKEEKFNIGIENQENNDNWWDVMDENYISSFASAVKLAETRFLQPELIDLINKSQEVNNFQTMARLTKEMILNKYVIDKSNLAFQPPKEIDNIPMIWFEAAEVVIAQKNEILNKNTVKLLASDAWKHYNLLVQE